MQLGIPLKTVDKKDGLLTPVEVHDMLKLVFGAVYYNTLPENNWSISRRASYFAQVLSQFVEKALSDAAPGLGIKTISAFLFQSHEPAHDFLHKISQAKAPHEQIIADVLGFAVASSVSLGKSTFSYPLYRVTHSLSPLYSRRADRGLLPGRGSCDRAG